MDFIVKNKVLASCFLVVVIALLILLLRWIYAINYFVLEDVDFKEARKKSVALSKKRHGKDLLTIVLVNFIVTVIYLIGLLLGIFLIILIATIFKNMIIKSVSTTVIWLFIALSFVVFTLLLTPISYATISFLFYSNKEAKKEKINYLSLKTKKQDNVVLKRVVVVLGIIALIGGTIFTYGMYKGKYNFNIEYTRTLEVTAHRGASVLYPENTMSAFIGAKKLGADWIELDVQQTKDGKIIVMIKSIREKKFLY